jgi:hypothetical protein
LLAEIGFVNFITFNSAVGNKCLTVLARIIQFVLTINDIIVLVVCPAGPYLETMSPFLAVASHYIKSYFQVYALNSPLHEKYSSMVSVFYNGQEKLRELSNITWALFCTPLHRVILNYCLGLRGL